jgi:hypothetical protein
MWLASYMLLDWRKMEQVKIWIVSPELDMKCKTGSIMCACRPLAMTMQATVEEKWWFTMIGTSERWAWMRSVEERVKLRCLTWAGWKMAKEVWRWWKETGVKCADAQNVNEKGKIENKAHCPKSIIPAVCRFASIFRNIDRKVKKPMKQSKRE